MNGLAALVVRRLLLGLVTVWAASVVIFAATEILPGDVATAILGQSATAENVAAIRERLQLDDPAVVRYGRWLGGLVQGDLGTSLAGGKPVVELISSRLRSTLFLATTAALLSVPLAILLGALAALWRDGLFDRIVSGSTLAAISMPEFFVGYVLIWGLAVNLGWFPALARITPQMGLGQAIYAIALPALTLTLVVLAHMMRMTRAAIIGVLSAPYIEMAELKGTPRAAIIFRHALPNALGPIINVVALNLAYLVVGVIVVEVVFAFPGMGQLMVDAVTKRDVPLVQACAMIFAAVYVGLNLTADIAGILANPRLRHPR